jgi:predicted nucleic acid-binding protein
MNKNTSCDASVIINFLRIKRMDLFEKCSHSFFITDHVQDEISNYYPDQRACLEDGLYQNILQKLNVESSQEFATFTDLNKSGQLGAGECAAIAVASHRGYNLAIDDNQAIKKALGLSSPPNIFRTQDLMLLMIQEELLEIDEADHLIEIWATQHRFKLKIKSFRELTNFPLKI